MAESDLLLEPEEIDENSSLLNYYQANLHFLKQVPLDTIPYYLLIEVAANFYGTSLDKDDWIGVLEDLGVDKTSIYYIDFQSRSIGKFPLHLAINGILKSNNTSLGDFVDTLCKIGKMHILRLLKPFTEEVLSRRHSLNEDEHYSEPKPSAPNYSSLEVTCSLYNPCGSGVLSAPLGDTGYDSFSSLEINERQIKNYKKDFEHFQNSDITSLDNKKQLLDVSNPFYINQSLGELSVFIMHSMLDKKYAKKLAKCLKEKNFRVITSANIYHILRNNPSMIMKVVDEQVDFVVPVVSESFVKQIEFTGFKAAEEKDLESVANSFLYDRLLNEYSHHNFLNRRVRPVCYSKEVRKLDKLDQILSWSAYLPYADLSNEKLLESEFLRHLRCAKKRFELSK